MGGHTRVDRHRPGGIAKKTGQRSTPLQEYDFFVAEEGAQAPQEDAIEVRPAKQRKKKEVSNKSKAFFLEGRD